MNTGILLSQEALETAWTNRLSDAIFFGLLPGKPIGILFGVWLGGAFLAGQNFLAT